MLDTALKTEHPSVSIEDIHKLIAEEMKAVNEVIHARLHSEVDLIRQVGQYIINSGGKRIRPTLVILAARAFGYMGQKHIELAAIIEFIHTATLLHDDVVDASNLRRGKPTANALFGNPASVLVGDFLYSRAFQMMVGIYELRVMRVLAEATNVIAEGEVLQLLNCHNSDTDEEDYLRVIRYKTAKLFEASTRLGAIIGGATGEQENAMAAFGMHLGTAFQLVDDALDYSGDYHKTGKNLGDDLAEGKPTLPLLYAMRRGSAQQAQQIRRAIEGEGLSEFESILDTIRETGALDYTLAQAQRETNAARDAVNALPRSIYKDCLLQLAAFAVERSY